MAGLTKREQRIEEVADLMNRGQWITGISDKQLAAKWGTAPDAVRRIAAEASRLIRARLRDDPEARQEFRAQGLQVFDLIRLRAMALGDAAGLRVALDAMRAALYYRGLEPPKEINVRDADRDFDGWSLDEMEAYAKDGRRPRRAAKKLAAMANGSADAGGGEEPVH
jgi:hypothetical protein